MDGIFNFDGNNMSNLQLNATRNLYLVIIRFDRINLKFPEFALHSHCTNAKFLMEFLCHFFGISVSSVDLLWNSQGEFHRIFMEFENAFLFTTGEFRLK